jgi:exopolysaccharide biosynthesis polyprenyl glycosylphosphotransferase
MASNDPPERRNLYMPAWFYPTADTVLVFVSFVIAYFFRYELQIFRPVLEVNRAAFSPYLVYAVFYAVYLFLNYQGDKLYKNVRGRSWFEELTMIINGVARVTVMAMAVSFFFQPLVSSRLMLAYVAAVTIILQSGMRLARRIIRAYLRTKGIGVQRVLVVGAGDVGKAVLRTMLARRELGYVPVGYVDDDPERASVSLGRLKGLGGTKDLTQTIRNNFVEMVVITLPWSEHDRILELVQTCQRAGVESRIVPDVFQLNLRQVHIENLDGIPLMGVNNEVAFQGKHWLLKRAIDLGLIIVAAPVLLVLFAVIALAIRLEGNGPIFYSQRRVGLNGREFNIYKFRSMIPNAEALREQLVKEHGEDPRHPKIKNDPRITRVGSFIRRTSMDELPNLLNVIRGQMSLVGPRPPTPDEVQLYEPWHMQRLQVLPGLTGLWQVSGRNEVPFDEMCLLDIYYIENWSVKLDAQILMMTVPRVILRHGAY